MRLSEIRRAQSFGCSTLNEIKGLTRVGMGNCQGRICANLLAHSLVNDDLPQLDQAQEFHNLGPFTVRPPIYPMTVQDLAQSAISESETDLDH